jgi:hypothetical protein
VERGAAVAQLSHSILDVSMAVLHDELAFAVEGQVESTIQMQVSMAAGLQNVYSNINA